MAIKIKKENVGKFTAYKKRTGKTTTEALHSKDPHVRQMANFARNAKKWKHPDGGVVKQPTLQVSNNVWTPQTRLSIYPQLAKAGILGSGQDSVTMEQWNRLTPAETLKYIDPNKGFDYTMGNTSNPGGVKYWSMAEIPNIGNYNRSTEHYWKEKKNTKYSVGGSILEGASTGVSTFASLAPLIGGPAGIAAAGVLGLGSLALGLNRDKKEKDAKLASQMTAKRDEQESANAAWQGYMAMGGLTPYGTDVEIEDGEVMRGNDGSMAEFSGPTHAEGGIDVSAEPGTQIFGNLKIKSGEYAGMQYKDAASLLRKKIARLQNKLNK